MMHAKLDCFGQTDTGLKRKENQDQFLIAEFSQSMRMRQSSLNIEDSELVQGRSQGQLLIVADGMGGHAGGKRASQLAVETMARCLLDMMPISDRGPSGKDEPHGQEQRLKEALDRCQARIEKEGHALPEKGEMGTTLTMAYLLWPTCYLLHVGDSRAYLFRNQRLHRLTEDQTVAERLVQKGELERSAVRTNALSHMLWGYLGVDPLSLKPELQRIELELNDTLLLCSDGLTKQLMDDQIGRLLTTSEAAQTTCEKLVQAALDAGGADNITVIVARIRNSDELLELSEAELEEPVSDLADTQEFVSIINSDAPEEAPLNPDLLSPEPLN